MNKKLYLSLCLVLPLCGLAQQKNQSLEAVVVTANKFEQKASETGKVITILTEKDLSRSSGKTLAELLNEQPGITINGFSESPGTNQTVYLRGADPKYTLIMIDGIPVNDVSYNDYKFDLNFLPLSAIERIEIMRGGYATLYGSGTAAGVINIITRKGGSHPFNLRAAISGGSYGTFSEQLGIEGHKGIIDYNVQLQQYDSRGFSSALDSTGHAGFDRDGFHRQSVFANIGIHPNTRWTFRPFIQLAHEKGDLDADAFKDDRNYDYTSTLGQAGLDIRYQFSGGDFQLKYNYNPIWRHYRNDSSDTPDYLRSDYKSDVHQVDAYAHFTASPRVSFLIGNSIRIEQTDQQSDGVSGGYPYSDKLSRDSARTNIMNTYGSFYLHTPRGFSLEASGRLNQHERDGFHPLFSLNPSWLIHNKWKIFANWSSSYVSPSLYQLYSAVYGNRELEPETGLNYEAGLETFLASQKLRLRATAFLRDLDDVIAFQNLHYVNYDQQKNWGGEIELDYAVTEHLQAKAFYAYEKGRVTTLNSTSGKDSSYNNLFKRPQNAAGLSLQYQATPALFLGLHTKYTGLRKDLTFLNYPPEVKDLKGYFICSLYIQYVWKDRYKGYIDLQNLTGSDYVETTGFATKGFNFQAGIQWSLF
jgi:vitamin B12 transporter